MRFRLTYLSFLIWLVLSTSLFAQQSSKQFDWNFQGESLDEVLEVLSESYQIKFAYSRAYLPMRDPIFLITQQASLNTVLSDICDDRDILYRVSGKQVLLRKRSRKIDELSQKNRPTEVPQQTPLYADPRREAMLAERRKLWKKQMPVINRRTAERTLIIPKRSKRQLNASDYNMPALDRFGDPLLDGEGMVRLDRPDLLLDQAPTPQPEPAPIKHIPNKPKPANRMAQISLLPYLGTNLMRSDRMSNNVSVNILWGTSGGVDGLEVGGIANNVDGDVQGIQVAGLANVVSDDMIGIQFAGIGNMVSGTTKGFQLGGLYNRTAETNAVQIAGFFNAAKKDFSGVQLASLFNVAKGEANGLQLSSMFNASGGAVKTQLAGILNVGGDVGIAQIAPLLNVGKNVKGVQVGLINVADTVSGLPVGLLNIVKRGYNRLELSTGETFFGNFAIKVGVKQFYNIFIVGGRYDDESNDAGESERILSWGLGYGVGTSVGLSRRYMINLEAVSMHVNERENWTSDLHQLHQLKVLLDGRIGRKISVFAGPVANLMVSRLEDAESGEIGTQLLPYTLYDKTLGGTRYQGWVGLNAGIRF